METQKETTFRFVDDATASTILDWVSGLICTDAFDDSNDWWTAWDDAYDVNVWSPDEEPTEWFVTLYRYDPETRPQKDFQRLGTVSKVGWVKGKDNVMTPEFVQWLNQGVQANYCSKPFCETHEGATLSADELAEFDSGNDPCLTMVRLLPPFDAVETTTGSE